jgi:hypothetical protein
VIDWSKVHWVEAPPPVYCMSRSSNRPTAMRCELLPDHENATTVGGPWLFHLGRDRLGRWRSWPLTPSSVETGLDDPCAANAPEASPRDALPDLE